MAGIPELQRARLKVKAMRAFVRDLDVALAQAEAALANHDRTSDVNPQPQEAQGANENSHQLAAV